MRKKYIILALILVLFFSIFYYKNLKLGNNIINLNEEKNIEQILSDNFFYEAKLEVTIYSNKNENEYNLKVKEDENYNLLEVIGNKEISGLQIEKKDGNLTIKNNKLKLEKIYEKYREFTDNSLFLNTFINEYKSSEEKEVLSENGEVVVKIKLKNSSKYIKYKELYLDEKTGKPIKMIIKNSSKQAKIIIKYTNIKIL